jgi:hypothetical protein
VGDVVDARLDQARDALGAVAVGGHVFAQPVRVVDQRL